MFLTQPTIEELGALDMPVLLDMLTYQSKLHSHLLKLGGVTATTIACRDMIINLQSVIEMKNKANKETVDNVTSISSTQHAL